jgi:hypothetical protein
MRTFAELFCQRYHIPPQRYAPAMFRRCLHRRAWLLLPLARLLPGRFFAADYELIHEVGRLTRASGVSDELALYYRQPGNRGFLRRRLRLRISGARVSRLVHRLFKPPPR